MKKILTMDAHNYAASLPTIDRVAVRGIITVDGKLLLIQSKYGEVKFPGGGQEAGESDRDTLIREVYEETGFHVRPDSIREFGEVEEKRLSTYEDMIWHQINRYYFCEVEPVQDACHYSDSEKECGFHQVWHMLEEALELNRAMLAKEGLLPYNQREFQVLELLKEHGQQ